MLSIKKQNKALRGDNAMVKRSKKLGSDQGEYVGKNPEFKFFFHNPEKQYLGGQWLQISKGIPFVRKHLK